MIPTGTRWLSRKGRSGLFAFTVVETTSEEAMAEIPYCAGPRMADRAQVALLVERAPLLRDECRAAAAKLRESGQNWVIQIALALETAAGGL